MRKSDKREVALAERALAVQLVRLVGVRLPSEQAGRQQR